MDTKAIWVSKTFWANLFAIAAMIVQSFTGWVLPPDWQATGLAVVNLILRIVTKQPVAWT